MTNKVRTHIAGDAQTPAGLAPKHLTKQEFATRVFRLMQAKGWNQSDLARHAGLPRDAVSVYIRGKSLPTPPNLKALAAAFNIDPTELLPNHIENAIDADTPSLEIKVSVSAPGMAWLRVNRLVTMGAAIKIADILENDRVLDRNGSSDASQV